MQSIPEHVLAGLFRQLGLADDPSAIERFVALHSPLPSGVALCDAPVWSAAQALREEHMVDANWSMAVDALSALMYARGRAES